MLEADCPVAHVSTEVAGGRVRVVVVGEVDLETAPLVRAPIDDALLAGATAVELDLGGVTFMDSTGLSILAVASDQIAARGGSITVTGASTTVRRLFEISGLDVAIRLT
jgi:anti-sigma B factor antagonist